MHPVLTELGRIAADPDGYARAWKDATGGKVVGTFAMHFPAEIIQAAGALPVLLQASEEPISIGHAGIYPFFCSYTRSLVDQNAAGNFDYVDSILFGDHCVQLLSAADIVRMQKPERHVGFYQLIPAISDNWSFENAERTLRRAIEDIEGQLGVSVSEDDLSVAIRVFNRSRTLVRKIYDLRREGRIAITSREMQHIVKSGMVMDKARHGDMLETLIADLEGVPAPHREGVPVFLSGHMCHAPKLDLLDLIEDCGGIVVDDDLYHGFRYVSLNAAETGDPVKALTSWYLDRNTAVPCPTRLDPKTDWDTWLLDRARASGAQGLVILLPKFCEPHYFFYPRIRKTFDDAGFFNLLLETEHESKAGENVRTRLESFIELVKRQSAHKQFA